MSTKTMADYLLLFRGPEWDQGLSEEEFLDVMDRVMAWYEGLTKQERIKAGQPLAREGSTVAAGNGRQITDGPFVESKEAIGGYLLLRATSLEEATTIARSFPPLRYGVTIEVRPLLDECPIFQRAKRRLTLVTA
jgi:hypothetical protein